MSHIDVSVIICTKNRADDLAQTLEFVAALPQAHSRSVEFWVVDNGSTDQTPQVIQAAAQRFPVRCVREERGGLASARNAGIKAARGEIIAFTDDDVRPASTWLSAVTAPIRQGNADIVAGGIRLADHLLRPWMEKKHLGMLAANTHDAPEEIKIAIGANLVFHRRVLEKVPQFDVELGAGASGFCEELLFNLQLKEAGFRLVPALSPEATVVHHPDLSRFTRAGFESRLRREGISLAYVHHHWAHDDLPQAKLLALKRRLRLALLRASGQDRGEVPPWGVTNVMQDVAYYDEMHRLRGMPRNYSKHGFVKQRGLMW